MATIDLARLVWDVCEDAASLELAVQHYRDALEANLRSRFADDQWEEMVDLGILTVVLSIAPFLTWLGSVYDDPAWVATLTRQVDTASDRIRDGVRWPS